MRTLLFRAGTVLVLLCGAAGFDAARAQDAYMFVEDSVGTSIPGPDTDPAGTPGAFAIREVHHLVTTNGGTTQPEHHPLVLTKLMDQASARFGKALVNKEPLSVTVKWYQGPMVALEFELTNAKVVAVEPITETDSAGPPEELERIRLSYDSIVIRNLLVGEETTWSLK